MKKQSSTSEVQAPSQTQGQVARVNALFSILQTALTIAGQE